jgi:xanthine dehydrogenase accessory factor
MRILRWAVDVNARYLGMIGSRRKTIAIYKELEKQGVSADKFAQVHAPVGLEIGAVTPEEIAVAIVAEMIAVRRHAVTDTPSKKYECARTHDNENRDAQDAIEEQVNRD